MKVVSLNIGKIQRYDWRGGTDSAMYKSAVVSAHLTELGFAGDEQSDLKNHGGVDKAVFLLPVQHYQLFGVTKPFGFLGENLSIDGLDETQVSVGDHLLIGEVLLEITQPRSPCWKLDQLGQDDLLNRYAQSGMVGFYCRVLQTGKVSQGDEIVLKPAQKLPRLLIRTLFLARHNHRTAKGTPNPADVALLKQAITHPKLSQAWHTSLRRELGVTQTTDY